MWDGNVHIEVELPLLPQHLSDVRLFSGMSEALHKVEFIEQAAKSVFVEQIRYAPSYTRTF